MKEIFEVLIGTAPEMINHVFLDINIPYRLYDNAKFKPRSIRAKTVFLNLSKNATRSNHDDLFLLSFILKISISSETSSEPSRASMMEFFAKTLSC